MKRKNALAGAAALGVASALAQTPPASPSAPPAPPAQQVGCDGVKSPESKQFDFWVGNWEFDNNGKKGINRISKILDNCVVFENFDGAPFKGQSLSTFDRVTKKWKQTWVDNSAAYLDFTGGFTDGKMILSREFELQGKKIGQRMVWFDIHPDAFQWNWERTEDGGKTWKVLWHLDYKRIQ